MAKVGDVYVDAAKVAPVPVLVLKIRIVGLSMKLWRMRAAILIVRLAQRIAGKQHMEVQGHFAQKGDIEALVQWAEVARNNLMDGRDASFPIRRMEEVRARIMGDEQ